MVGLTLLMLATLVGVACGGILGGLLGAFVWYAGLVVWCEYVSPLLRRLRGRDG